jgi:hypothetical protein
VIVFAQLGAAARKQKLGRSLSRAAAFEVNRL